jgi:hypothetical protein
VRELDSLSGNGLNCVRPRLFGAGLWWDVLSAIDLTHYDLCAGVRLREPVIHIEEKGFY